MSQFFAQALSALPNLRTRLQYGFGILVVLAFVFVQASGSTPVLPQIFIFAVVPLLLAFNLVKTNWPAKLQFIVTMAITLMATAFLATGVILALYDRTPNLVSEYQDKILPVESALDQKYLIGFKPQWGKLSYSEIRDLVLKEARYDNSEVMTNGLDRIVLFYESYIACRNNWQCSPSKQLETGLVNSWYTYRPILEERRLSFWTRKYAAELQRYAEAIRPPLYRSEVEWDPVTKAPRLKYPEPTRKLSQLMHHGAPKAQI
jgi:hypothetical protein